MAGAARSSPVSHGNRPAGGKGGIKVGTWKRQSCPSNLGAEGLQAGTKNCFGAQRGRRSSGERRVQKKKVQVEFCAGVAKARRAWGHLTLPRNSIGVPADRQTLSTLIACECCI